jgi:hypothetical protein
MKKKYLFFLIFFSVLSGLSAQTSKTIDFDESIKLYPNPVYNMLSVQSNNTILKVEIQSMLGDRVKTVKSNFKYINLIELPRGIYMIKIHTEKGYAVKKLIKN